MGSEGVSPAAPQLPKKASKAIGAVSGLPFLLKTRKDWLTPTMTWLGPAAMSPSGGTQKQELPGPAESLMLMPLKPVMIAGAPKVNGESRLVVDGGSLPAAPRAAARAADPAG